jgi:hypothetical protein
VAEPAFYAYAYPEPADYGTYGVRPAEARYSAEMREYILPYDAVRLARDPDRMLQDFFRSTYEAGAVLGGWDRGELEHDYPAPPAAASAERPAPAFPRHDDEPPAA